MEEDLCICGHGVEDHNDIWKHYPICARCSCKKWISIRGSTHDPTDCGPCKLVKEWEETSCKDDNS